MPEKLSRRDFMVAGAVAAGITVRVGARPGIPRRVLGRTGAEVSILGFGGGSRFLMYEDETAALDILNEAVDAGVNYLDTAMTYGNGESERRIGLILKERRREVWITTKVSERGYDAALRAADASLKRLQTDRVDLLHIHSLEDGADLAAIESPEGVLRALYRLREEGMARFIGMTSHSHAETMRTAIERHDLDCVMMALNAATRSGFATGFEAIALPAARRKGLGILAMKIAGQEQLVGSGDGRTSMKDLLDYSLGLPVASCIVGMPRPEFLRENLALARDYRPVTEADRERIRQRVEPSAAALDRFLRGHSDLARS
jgi:uncharacterized protein